MMSLRNWSLDLPAPCHDYSDVISMLKKERKSESGDRTYGGSAKPA